MHYVLMKKVIFKPEVQSLRDFLLSMKGKFIISILSALLSDQLLSVLPLFGLLLVRNPDRSIEACPTAGKAEYL